MAIAPEDIKAARMAFAEELRYVAHVRSSRVIAAFASVPREDFLGERPWQVYDFANGYWTAPGDDPSSAYHNVLFAIDADRFLNNGQPHFWARLLDKLEVRSGDRVYHVGAGVGYYTAIIAALTEPGGAVVAAEIDAVLAERARGNLASLANVAVVGVDGASYDPGPVDVIIINAGATHPLPIWLAALKPGGRMLLPLTADDRQGAVFRIERLADANSYSASAISGVTIYPCASARSPEAERRLARALAKGGQNSVRSLRLDAHDHNDNCWLHGDGYCFSTRPERLRWLPSVAHRSPVGWNCLDQRSVIASGAKQSRDRDDRQFSSTRSSVSRMKQTNPGEQLIPASPTKCSSGR